MVVRIETERFFVQTVGFILLLQLFVHECKLSDRINVSRIDLTRLLESQRCFLVPAGTVVGDAEKEINAEIIRDHLDGRFQNRQGFGESILADIDAAQEHPSVGIPSGKFRHFPEVPCGERIVLLHRPDASKKPIGAPIRRMGIADPFNHRLRERKQGGIFSELTEVELCDTGLRIRRNAVGIQDRIEE